MMNSPQTNLANTETSRHECDPHVLNARRSLAVWLNEKIDAPVNRADLATVLCYFNVIENNALPTGGVPTPGKSVRDPLTQAIDDFKTKGRLTYLRLLNLLARGYTLTGLVFKTPSGQTLTVVSESNGAPGAENGK